ncbi:MAG: efflux transporter outer membrane subunit [Pseudomonadota bacterium]
MDWHRLVGLLLLWLTGCTVGPDYVQPEVAVPEQFGEGGTPTVTHTAALWRDFEDDALSALIDLGLARNFDIQSSLARLDESRALSGLSKFSLFPTVTASASSERNRQSGRDPFTFEGLGVSEVHQFQFDSVWEIDLFGSLKRQNQQIVRRVQADQARAQDMRRIITAEIAQSYYSLRGVEARRLVQQRAVDTQQERVAIIERALSAGRGTALDLARVRTQESVLRATLPPLEAERERARQRLAVLISDNVFKVDELLALSQVANDMVFPEALAIGTPEEWLKRRPDVRVAERELAIASATIGVQTAEFYPKLNLVGNFGYSGTALSDLGESDATKWRIGPSLQWRFLDFGRVRQRVMAAEAAERRALADFRVTLLRALEDMENALTAFRTTSESVIALEQAYRHSLTATRLARLRFDNGASGLLEVLDTERTEADIANQLAQAKTVRATALVAVYKALAAN